MLLRGLVECHNFFIMIFSLYLCDAVVTEFSFSYKTTVSLVLKPRPFHKYFCIVNLNQYILFRQTYLKFAALLPFLAFTLATVVYVFIVLPETKGKSVVFIQRYFAKWNKTALTPTANIVESHENAAYEFQSNSDVRSTKF